MAAKHLEDAVDVDLVALAMHSGPVRDGDKERRGQQGRHTCCARFVQPVVGQRRWRIIAVLWRFAAILRCAVARA